MMIVNVPLVDMVVLQTSLDTQLGAGVFTVAVDKTVTPKQMYLEYQDSTPQATVDEAVAIAQQEAQVLLNESKVRSYQYLITVATKKIESLDQPNYTNEEVQESNIWLQNQSLPVPSIVTYTALSYGITDVQAAQKIVSSKSTYDSKVLEIETLQAEGQSAILAATDTYSAKTVCYDYMEQIKNIE